MSAGRCAPHAIPPRLEGCCQGASREPRARELRDEVSDEMRWGWKGRGAHGGASVGCKHERANTGTRRRASMRPLGRQVRTVLPVVSAQRLELCALDIEAPTATFVHKSSQVKSSQRSYTYRRHTASADGHGVLSGRGMQRCEGRAATLGPCSGATGEQRRVWHAAMLGACNDARGMQRGVWHAARRVACSEACGMQRGVWHAARRVACSEACGEACGMQRGVHAQVELAHTRQVEHVADG
jgi:hypothetical protein